jgi:CheY-like chemotaxis protein
MVSDTGIGIEHEQQSLLFKEFSQADASTTKQFGGTGLGLAISRRLIELMGGMLDFSSEPGVGSRFWFTLPMLEVTESMIDTIVVEEMASPHAAPGDAFVATFLETPGRATQSPVAPPHVLVAEDNIVNQRLVKRILEKLGCTVDMANDGQQAVTLAVAGQYDLVFMDCSMPEMDGYQATGEIRRLQQEGSLPRVPIVALTANALREDRDKCLAAGMDDYLSKPVSQAELRTMLVKYVPQNALFTTPPSTRSAAPVVAEERGLAT